MWIMIDYVVCGYLILIGISDIKYKKIPLCLLLIGLFCGLIYGVSCFGICDTCLALIPGVILSVFAWLFPQSLGIGDGMVAMLYGMVYGWQKVCICLLFAFCITAVTGVFAAIVCRKRQLVLPFIPFFGLIHMVMSL